MKMQVMKNIQARCLGIRFLVLLLLSFPASAEPLTLKHAVELALEHASGLAIAADDEQHATASLHELRNSYIPQLNAGAGLGWSDGFPLSLEGAAPSLFNVNAQSALINPALKDFIRAAQSEVKVSALRSRDQRNQVIQDTVLSYAELEKWQQRLDRLREIFPDAQKMEAAVARRVQEGVDSELDESKARLSVARLRLRLAEASGSADVLREHLSKLTGLSASSIEIDPESVPPLPKTEANDDQDLSKKASDANPNVQAAVEHARAQYLKADGERRSLWPSLDFAAQYANLATFNNYDAYYKHFQPNNATVGVSIHLPFLNLAQISRVQEAKSEARKAQSQAQAARNQVSEETLRLQRSVTQMQAARDVAELESEIAQKNVQAVETRMQSGGANLHDLDAARTQASERLIALQDVAFELERSQIALLRATGGLENWATGAP
jgi:outer membrane protein TolC